MAAAKRDYPGSNLAAYFAARGELLSPDQAAELLRVLLRLSDLGALEHLPTDQGTRCPPTGAAPSGAVRAAGAGDTGGHGSRKPSKGPTVYNVGPSNYIGTSE